MCKQRRSQLGALMYSNIKGGGHPEAAVCVGDGVPERRQGGVWHLRGGGVPVSWGTDPGRGSDSTSYVVVPGWSPWGARALSKHCVS